jgi:hypothetical protein
MSFHVNRRSGAGSWQILIGYCYRWYDRVFTLECLFIVWANDRAKWINNSFGPLDLGSFSRTMWTLKSFKLSTCLIPRSRVQIAWVVETERHLFSWEVNHHIVACCAYKAERH